MQRVNTSRAKTVIGVNQCISPTESALAKPTVEAPNDSKPIRMIGLRPHRSLRRPQNGELSTQIVAEIAKIEPTWNSLKPKSRASGGRMANISVCPMPLAIRQQNKRKNARRRPSRLVTLPPSSAGANAARARPSQPELGEEFVWESSIGGALCPA